jgi:tetratricopeptide (TPR) repeat protein
MTGLARWLRAAGDLEGARTLLRRAFKTSDTPLPEPLLFHVMWDLAQLERKLDAREQALGLWEELAALSLSNPFQVRAIEELAKHHEHHSKDREKALAWTRAARAIEDSPELARREARLSRVKPSRKMGTRKMGTPRAKKEPNTAKDLRGA